jgi:hypothetical protein
MASKLAVVCYHCVIPYTEHASDDTFDAKKL